MSLRIAATLVSLVVLGALPATAIGAERGRVGGPPTLRFDRAKQSGKLTTKAIVIKRFRSTLGPVELIAYGTDGCLTIEFDVLREKSASATCHEDPGPRAISVDGASWRKRRNGRGQFTVFLGGAGSEVTSTDVEGRGRNGSELKGESTLARPNADILRRLRQSEPIVAWAAELPGCASGKRFTVSAFAADGGLLASIHDPWQGDGFYPCK